MSKMEDFSDDEDDKYQSSGEDWTPKTAEKKRGVRRTSQRLRKKLRITQSVEDSSASEEEIERKQKKDAAKKSRISKRTPPAGMHIVNDDFEPGGFLVLKKDVQTGDSSKQPCLWRIDGKALLQKYESFTEDDKVLHRSTSIYTGWSPLDKDLYAPVNVLVQVNAAQQMVVELDWETFKHAALDSD